MLCYYKKSRQDGKVSNRNLFLPAGVGIFHFNDVLTDPYAQSSKFIAHYEILRPGSRGFVSNDAAG